MPNDDQYYHKSNWATWFNAALMTGVYLLGSGGSKTKFNYGMISTPLILSPNIIPITLPLLFSQLSFATAERLTNKPKKIIVVQDRKHNKKTLFLNSKGYMEHLWLYHFSAKKWENLSPNHPIDLDQNGYVNSYSTINNHVFSVHGQNKVLLVGYSDNDEINLFCYHVDGNNWEKFPSILPEYDYDPVYGVTNYHDFIQSNIVSVNGKEKLFLLTCSSVGFKLYSYDIQGKNWEQLVTGIAENSNKNNWEDRIYHSTIQMQALKTQNNQEKLFLTFRSSGGIELLGYDPHTKALTKLPSGPAWSDSSEWAKPEYYSTIQTQTMKIQDNQEKLFLLGRDKEGIEIVYYTPKTAAWSFITPPEPLHLGKHYYSDQFGFNEARYYPTIHAQVVKTARGQEKLFLFNRHALGTELQYYDPNIPSTPWNRMPDGPIWGNAEGWDNSQYYLTIGSQSAFKDDHTENLLVHGHSKNEMELHYYDIAQNSWGRFPNVPILGNHSWYKPQYYQDQKANYDELCEFITNYVVEQDRITVDLAKLAQLAQKNTDLNYGLELEIVIDSYTLYLIAELNEQELYKLNAIRGNAIVLSNDNTIYFVKNGKIERDAYYKPKCLMIPNRPQEFCVSHAKEPIMQMTNYREYIKGILTQIDIDKNIVKHANNIPLRYYEQTPLGLALAGKVESSKAMITSLLSFRGLWSSLERHSAVYFYMAAKSKSELGVILAQNLLNLCGELNIVLDLMFTINNKVIDPSVAGKRDPFELAIQNNNFAFIDWILSDEFISTKIFQVKIKHLQLAIKTSQAMIVNLLLEKIMLPWKEIMQGLQEKFVYSNRKISYLQYAKSFNKEVYQVINEWLSANHDRQEDISLGMKIVDTEGCFAQQENCQQDTSFSKSQSILYKFSVESSHFGYYTAAELARLKIRSAKIQAEKEQLEREVKEKEAQAQREREARAQMEREVQAQREREVQIQTQFQAEVLNNLPPGVMGAHITGLLRQLPSLSKDQQANMRTHIQHLLAQQPGGVPPNQYQQTGSSGRDRYAEATRAHNMVWGNMPNGGAFQAPPPPQRRNYR